MKCTESRLRGCVTHLFRRGRGIALTVMLAALLASGLVPSSRAWANVMTGDQFSYVADATLLDGFPIFIPDAVDGTFTIGSPAPGVCAACFGIVNLRIVLNFANSPALLPITTLFFDSATLDILGTQTFTTLGAMGATHDETLSFTDFSRTWSDIDVNEVTHVVRTVSGPYTLATVPEPGTALLVGLALALLTLTATPKRRRRQ